METNMIATATNEILVECMQEVGDIRILVVALKGEVHHELYRCYSKLPDVLKFRGEKFGKSCWDSDKHLAYYRNDREFASICSR
jgi:hypothetical protein